MEIVLNVRSENLDNNLTAVDSNFSKPNYYGISISVLKGSVCKGRLAFSLFSEKIKISNFFQKPFRFAHTICVLDKRGGAKAQTHIC